MGDEPSSLEEWRSLAAEREAELHELQVNLTVLRRDFLTRV